MHLVSALEGKSISWLNTWPVHMAKRDVKNVADDVKYLEQIGLIEKKKTKSRTAPVVPYEKLMLEIAV
jgi:predicted transcriptional regulator